MVIFKAQHTNSKWIPTNTPLNWHFSTSASGWTSNSHGYEWLQKVFIPKSNKRARRKMLIMDGHSSYITGNIIALCIHNCIGLLILPLHYLHLL